MKRQASILLALTLAACGGGADFTPTNQPPTAKAGPTQNVAVGDTVTLAGSGTDPDQDPLTYLWVFTKPDGSSASLTNTHVATPTFVADIGGIYTATLTVNDGKVSSAPSMVTIAAQVQTAAFVKQLEGSCATSSRIFIIDQHLVYVEVASTKCSDYNSAALYESSPDRLLCTVGGFVAQQNCPGGATYSTMLQTMYANAQKPDLGLGSTHTVQLAYSTP